MDAKPLLAEALHLSAEERAALAGEPIQSLNRDIDPAAEPAWSEEIRDAGRTPRCRNRQDESMVGGVAR